MVSNASISQLSDCDLLAATACAVADERRCTASLLELLGEVDERRLYLGQSCSSLFTYCSQVLHLSEDAAYYRMEAARAARQFPVILEMIREGALTFGSASRASCRSSTSKRPRSNQPSPNAHFVSAFVNPSLARDFVAAGRGYG